MPVHPFFDIAEAFEAVARICANPDDRTLMADNILTMQRAAKRLRKLSDEDWADASPNDPNRKVLRCLESLISEWQQMLYERKDGE